MKAAGVSEEVVSEAVARAVGEKGEVQQMEARRW